MQKHSLNYLITEAFRYNVYHFQCLAILLELAMILVVFLVIGVELAEMLSLIGVCDCAKECMGFVVSE